MSNELDQSRENALMAMLESEQLPAVPDLDLSACSEMTIPVANLATWGVAFQPLTAAIQTAVTGAGGSGIYFVNTMGKQMFTTSGGTEFIGSLKSAAGTVGGGQARMTILPCDPTMLFMAAVLANVEKKLDAIQETQEEILEYLKDRDRAELQANLNALGNILNEIKFNWNNETFKQNKLQLIQDTIVAADKNINLYRSQIAKRLKKRTAIHGDKAVRELLKDLQSQFSDYQLALYLYSYGSFLEVMLQGNYNEAYLTSVEQRISEYSLQYRTLYTECYDLMEEYSKSSIQSGMLGILATGSRKMGEAIARVPVISSSQLDENLIDAGSRLGRQGNRRADATLAGLAQTRANVTQPFVEHIQTVRDLYNKPVTYLIDGKNVYVRQLAE